MNCMGYTALELGKKIKAKEISVLEALEDALKQIRKQEHCLNSFITVEEEAAKKRAVLVQRAINEGTLQGPLAGVPAAVKDNLCTKGIKTTCGSLMLSNFVPCYSAQAVANLEAAGAVLIGKTNMDEFAMGSTSETSAFGAVKNPWNVGHVSGGSSGGSCAATAAEECSYALGSDTGGSIRLPSAYCGVTGIKPTYGTVSRYGLVAYASSLDQIGPIGKNVSDCAAVLEVISSYDKKDSTSIKRTDMDFTSALRDDVRGMKIGIPEIGMDARISPAIKKAMLSAAKIFEEKGAHVEEFKLNLWDYAVPAYYVIACAEASSNLARYDGVKYGYRSHDFWGLHDMYKKTRAQGFGGEVKRRIMVGTFVLSAGYYDAYYLKAMKVRTLIKQEYDRIFQKYDILLTPTAASSAPMLGASRKDPMSMYLGDIYTVSANLAGLPAISIPCGVDEDGLPIGLELMADCFKEKDMIRAAYSFEQTRPYLHSPMSGKHIISGGQKDE